MKTMTVNEAAGHLGKHPETVRRWISKGSLEAIHRGAEVLIPEKALAPFSSRTCENCKKTYTPSRPTRKGRYCSKACAWMAAARRRKAAAAAKAHERAEPPKAPVVPVNEHLEAVLKYVQKRSRKE